MFFNVFWKLGITEFSPSLSVIYGYIGIFYITLNINNLSVCTVHTFCGDCLSTVLSPGSGWVSGPHVHGGRWLRLFLGVGCNHQHIQVRVYCYSIQCTCTHNWYCLSLIDKQWSESSICSYKMCYKRKNLCSKNIQCTITIWSGTCKLILHFK